MPGPHPSHHQPTRRHVTLGLGLGLGWLALAGGCSSLPTGATDTSANTSAWRAGPGQALLLGEVHDNAAQHAWRAQGLAALLARGDRPVLLMEQFDRERQAAIDAVRAGHGTPAAGALDAQVTALAQAGGAGWDWPLYTPYLRLALAHGLPIVAANVSRADARLVMQQGLAATGWQADVPADISQALAQTIADSHCGQLDSATAARLALAQVARDQGMARLVARHAAQGVVLLAGNGHVRADTGVPRWLPPALRARTWVVGALEPGDSSAAAFDSVWTSPAQPRPDPCIGLRMPAANPAKR